MIQRRRRSLQSRAPGIWTQDYSGGLTPKVKSALASWTLTAGVTWDGSAVAMVGASRSMQAAFTAPAENYVIDVQAYFPAAANTLSIELLSGISGTVRFTLAANGATDAITANGATVTPAGLDVGQWVRYRLVVRPSTTDVIAYAYYYDPGYILLTRHVRLETAGAVKAWSYAGGIGALRLSSTSGTVYVRDVSVKPILGVIIGDSISTGAGAGASPPNSGSGYNPTPYLLGPRSGDTHTWKWYIENGEDADHGSTILAQGTGGLGMSDTVARWADYVVAPLAGMSTKRVIVHAGTNDINNGDTGAAVLANLDLVLAAASGMKLAIGTVLPRTVFNGTKDTHAATFNAGLLARVSSTVKVLDWSDEYPELIKSGTTFDMNPLYSDDGTHLTWTAYRRTAPLAVEKWNEL